jgi:predicted Zn finger-like uncharacterized protein
MFTTCPACRMNLAVTATDLRLGQGYVRCGRCERVFNALMSLADDLDPEEQSGHAAHGTTSLPAIQMEKMGAASNDPPPDPGRASDERDDEISDHDEDDDSSSGQVDVTDSASTGTVETIVLEGDTYLQTEEHLDEEEVRQRMRDFTGEAEPEAAPEASPELEPEAEPQEIDADAAVGNAPRAHWIWRVVAVLLVLVLAGQLVHHYRQVLVAKPWLEKPMQALYGLFDVRLEPAWDLGSYDLRQLGGEELGPNSTTILLRATVHNRAAIAQPPPLIRVRLEDRFGNVLSTTELAPVEYLNGSAPARMAPDQRLDVELRLADPDRQAGSFDLDACLPDTGGKAHCAHDP